MSTAKKTKIVATIGPTSDSPELIRELIQSGVNVFRFNMKHNSPEWHLLRIELVQKIAFELNVHIGILIDLQGPEIRIDTKNQDIAVNENDMVVLTSKQKLPDYFSEYKIITLNNDIVTTALNVHDKFTIDEGLYEFSVYEKINNQILLVKSAQKGIIKHRKSMNLIGLDVPLPSMIDEDLDKLDLASKMKVDFIALSFTRSKKDIQILRKEMEKRKINAKIVAKIESQAGITNIDEIIQNADAVMIARGDLGIEIPMEEIPYLQKEIIKKCRDHNIPVIVATQMLQSMIENPIPTRAEAADVANAIFDETDAIMLSGETASGKYPLKAVRFMKKMALFNEYKMLESIDNIEGSQFYKFTPTSKDQTHALVRAALSMLNKDSGVKVDKVLVFTESGYTARVISSFRPIVPIIALSENAKTIEALTLNYGIIPVLGKFNDNSFSYSKLFNELKKADQLKDGDLVVIVHGKRWQDEGKTNALVVLTV